jgi:tetratricopeptide (TPR) repeat protein
LGKRKRITKKELKHDALLESASQLTRIVEHHLPKVAIGLAAVVVVILVSVVVVRARRSTERDAGAALTNAVQTLNSGLVEQAETEMGGVVGDVPGTRSAGAATCYLGTIYYQEGRYDEALQQFDEYLTRYRGAGNLRRVALEGKASVHEQLRDFQEAADIYHQLAQGSREIPTAFSRFMLSAMRCYQAAGDWQNAELAAQQVIDADPESNFAGEARVALAEAEARSGS